MFFGSAIVSLSLGFARPDTAQSDPPENAIHLKSDPPEDVLDLIRTDAVDHSSYMQPLS